MLQIPFIIKISAESMFYSIVKVSFDPFETTWLISVLAAIVMETITFAQIDD